MAFLSWKILHQECRINAIEKCFRSTTRKLSGQEINFFQRQAENKRRKRGKKNSTSPAFGPAFASQHTDKKHQNSYDAKLADQPKKKKTPAQVARDCARQKSLLEEHQSCQKAKSWNLVAHNAQLKKTKTVASPQWSLIQRILAAWRLPLNQTLM